MFLGNSKFILAPPGHDGLLAFSVLVGMLVFKAAREVGQRWWEKGKKNPTKLSALIEIQLFFFFFFNKWSSYFFLFSYFLKPLVNWQSSKTNRFWQLLTVLTVLLLLLTVFTSALFASKEEWIFRDLYPTTPTGLI